MISRSGSGSRSAGRGAGHRPVLAIFGLLVLVIAAAVSGFFVLSRPAIGSIDPAFAEPGAVVSINGSNFGAERGDSQVEVDGVAPTSDSYIDWSPTRISVRLPGTVDSGLVYVITDRGRSNPKLFMNKSRLPVEPQALASGGTGPWIGSLSEDRGYIEMLLTIKGSGFGSRMAGSSVRFAWNPEDPPGAPGERSSAATIAPVDPWVAYEAWSDSEIQVHVPDGTVSGAVFVRTPQGDSNSVFFDVTDQPGTKRLYDRRSYSISYSVAVSKVQASGVNELWLRVPRPAEDTSQLVVRNLQEDPAPFNPNDHGYALYRFRDLQSGQNVSVNLGWLVQTYAIETKIDPDKVRPTEVKGDYALAYLVQDSLVPSTDPDVVKLAASITKGELNPYKAAKDIYDWLTQSLRWQDGDDKNTAVEALAARKAGSWNYGIIATALLRAAGVPALPVGGLLVDPSRATVRHSWVEFLVPAFGWVPMDPILGSGARPGGFQPAFDDVGKYFGNLDDRRIAFSRGYVDLEPMAANGRRASPSRPVAYQNWFEEAAGALEAYSSFWSDIEVTGLY
ncbi:MAG TPA: transglutaminase domain-containing protein [Rectinemataceae bacterium]|nr:transglutaminase domain-containing protein [Rectinemataceae bacterium]